MAATQQELYRLKEEALAEGVTMSEKGRRGGARAHRILDWVILDGKYYCKTPRMDWHRATDREYALLKSWGALW